MSSSDRFRSDLHTAGKMHPGLTARGAAQHARLLLIASDPKLTARIRTPLTLAGYAVTVCQDGASALAAAQAEMPDLALLATSLPDAAQEDETAAIVAALKSKADGTYLPLLLLAPAGADEEALMIESGADDLLPAACTVPQMRGRVRTLLHLKRQFQAFADSAQEMEATQETARRAAAYYKAMFLQSLNALLLVSAEGRILQANHCALALTGFEAADLVGQPLERISPPEVPWVASLIAEAAAGSFSDPDAALLTCTKEWLPVEVCAIQVHPETPVSGEHGATVFLVTLRDRRSERAHIAEAQAAATAETIAAFSREINNPLFVISSNVEMLQTAMLNEDSAMRAKINRIADAVQRMIRAVGKIAVSMPPKL